jgi:hypothetical protein
MPPGTDGWWDAAAKEATCLTCEGAASTDVQSDPAVAVAPALEVEMAAATGTDGPVMELPTSPTTPREFDNEWMKAAAPADVTARAARKGGDQSKPGRFALPFTRSWRERRGSW